MSNLSMPTGNMVIPTSLPEQNYVERDPVPAGIHPAYIAHIIDMGTQETEWKGVKKFSRQMKFVFELPHEKREFSADKGLQSSLLWKTSTFVMSDQSTLYKIVKAATNTSHQPSHYSNFNLGELLGKKLTLNIEHKTKKDGSIQVSIAGYSPFNPNLVNPEIFVPSIKNHFFLINTQVEDMNFLTMNFAVLYEGVRSQIMESQEAKAYADRGGKFAQHIDDSSPISAPAPAPSPESNSDNGVPSNIVWLSKEYSYDDLKGAGWNDQQMIDNGYAELKKEQAPVPPAPKAAPVPPAPKSAPVPPSAPTPPSSDDSSDDDEDFDFDDVPF